MIVLRSLALVPRIVHGLVDEGALTVTRHTPLLPVCGLSDPGCGLRTATGPVGFARALGVTVRGLNDCTRVRLPVARSGMTGCGHTGPITGRVTVTGHVTVRPFPPTVRGLGKGVGGLGRVTGIAQRQLLPPGIVATLGRRWSLPLQLRVAPFLSTRPLCRTLPGCFSACLHLWRSGMRP